MGFRKGHSSITFENEKLTFETRNLCLVIIKPRESMETTIASFIPFYIAPKTIVETKYGKGKSTDWSVKTFPTVVFFSYTDFEVTPTIQPVLDDDRAFSNIHVTETYDEFMETLVFTHSTTLFCTLQTISLFIEIIRTVWFFTGFTFSLSGTFHAMRTLTVHSNISSFHSIIAISHGFATLFRMN
jgi:hypothetical protein